MESLVDNFHFHGFILGCLLHGDAILDVTGLFTMDFYHREIRLQHSPFVGYSFFKIGLVPSEANPFFFFIDKVHKYVWKVLVHIELH